MSQVAISGNASGTGTLTIAAPNTNSNYTLTLPQATTTLVGTDATQTLTNKTIQGGAITSGTAVASTSGTSIDFTGIPSWVKRVTINFSGVSTSATAKILVQLGTGSTTYTTSGYIASSVNCENAGNSVASSTSGFVVFTSLATAIISGHMIITNISGNDWVSSHTTKRSTTSLALGGGNVSLGAVLTAVRITTDSTDTFDAGSVNIMYEG